MKDLLTPRLVIRNWQERDRPLFHRINSDDKVMEFFPMRRTRIESDAMMDRVRSEADANGFGWTAVEIRATAETIGFIGLNLTEIAGVIAPNSMEIGWRLAPEYWGHGYVTEAAAALLGQAFDVLGREEVWSFAVVDNRRSIAVMERLGMLRVREFEHPRVPDTHPALKSHALYRISAAEWRKHRGAEKARRSVVAPF